MNIPFSPHAVERAFRVCPCTAWLGEDWLCKNWPGDRKISVVGWRCAVVVVILWALFYPAMVFNLMANGKEMANMSMNIISQSFMHEREIPVRHTCDGLNTSPPVMWMGIPSAARSLVLIVDDPDAPDPAAPKMTWVHWLLYNIPVNVKGLPEGATEMNLPAGIRHGINDWHDTSYGGPCPPIGKHRYFFKLYALDSMMPDLEKPTKAALERAMKGHVLAQASLIGLYQRQGEQLRK